MKQNQASPGENPFSYLWIANCVLYSVVVAFLLNKGWKKQRNGTSAGGASKQQKWKRVYEKRVVEVKKKISIAQAELERIKENRKITTKKKKRQTKPCCPGKRMQGPVSAQTGQLHGKAESYTSKIEKGVF